MATDKEFDNILNECLERLLIRGDTLEQCVQSYPEQAAELETLLQTAMATKEALTTEPRPEFKARLRYQLLSKLQETASRRTSTLFSWIPRWATVAIMILGLIMTGGGTVTAASYSMPDNLLYPVKLATEQVWLALTPSDIGKAQLNANLADKRIDELFYIADKGDVRQIEKVAQHLDENLKMMNRFLPTIQASEAPQAAIVPQEETARAPMVLAPAPAAESAPAEETPPTDEKVSPGKGRQVKLKDIITNYATNHPAVLRAVLEKVPEQAKPALRRAIANSENSYGKALKALD